MAVVKSSAPPLRIGIVGCGIVGGGVAELLLAKNRPQEAKPCRGGQGRPKPPKGGAARPWERDDVRFELRRVADIRWPKPCPVPQALRANDWKTVTDDPEIDVVLELMGGTGLAFEVVARALKNGKHVVTANKALLAEKGAELFRLAKKTGREIAFEAAVAGGIPILQAIQTGLAANTVKTVFGILNGTTNFILTRMTETRAAFADALAEAQKLGFAEADPTLDVEGIDAAHKLQLLTALAFGLAIPMKKIPVQGITKVHTLDISYAEQLGCVIKLLGTARTIPEGLEIRVGPTLVPKSHPLASIRREVNAVYVSGDRVGDAVFVGRGAGRFPTASAVVSDLIRMAKDGCRPMYVNRMTSAAVGQPVPPRDYRSRYYVRLTATERPGVLSRVTKILGDAGISIASVVQMDPDGAATNVPVALLTRETTEERIRKAVGRIDKLPVIAGKSVVFPFVE